MFAFNFVILFQSIIFSLPGQAVFILSLLLTQCLGSPLGPLVSLLQDDMMDAGAMAGGAGAAMDMADMTAMGETIINS